METKLKEKICLWIVKKFEGVYVFTFGLDFGYLGSSIAVVINDSLARHVCKISEVSSWLLSIKLLFKNKLSVLILGLYAGASLMVHLFQADKINSLIARAVNKSLFVVLGGDFNEDGFYRCASFKKCLGLELVNFLVGSSAVQTLTWTNSQGVAKVIDYVFVFANLVSALVHHDVLKISEHFDTNHWAVSVFVGLSRLVNAQLNSFHKQTNMDCWKYDIKSTDEVKWCKFKMSTAANAAMFSDEFGFFVASANLDSMWNIVRKIIVFLANETFRKKWFKNFDSVFTKKSSKFHKLEILISRIVKASYKQNSVRFTSLMNHWAFLDSDKALVVQMFLNSDANLDHVSIRSVINKHMESFAFDKSHTIKSVLEHSFHKVELDHLVVGDKLILEPDLVKTKSLEYVFNSAFLNVMQLINFNELFGMVFDLLNSKAAGLSDISNELWKHCDKFVISMLLELLNTCLSSESVPCVWKEAWKGILTNICSIVLIEMAHKILFKILSDRISLAYNHFDVFYGDNFSVLKDTSIQSPIFTVSSVIEDALDKNRKLWLVLVMTDFDLIDGYCVYDGLDQEKVFSSLFWPIFYNPLLCKVKRQKNVCVYRLNSHFISKNGHLEPNTGLSSFFAAEVFVNDTIWIGSSRSATQLILNIASEFFQVNDIFINTDKTVVIPINYRVNSLSLFISGSPIAIVKKGESHHYLGIFLSSEGLSKSSLAKACLNIQFFSNLVLRKAISDKQFLYLVSAILHPILKSGLSLDFLNDTIHYPSFYGLKSFKQVQFKNKIVLLVNFVNAGGILGCIFSHRSHDLQVLCWHPTHLLSFSVHICVSFLNNFLASVVHIFAKYNLSLGRSLSNFFYHQSGVLMSVVFGEAKFCVCVSFLCWYDVVFHWKRLDPCSPVPDWFSLSVIFFNNVFFFPVCVSAFEGVDGHLSILEFQEFKLICDQLSCVGTGCLSVYTDGSLRDLGTIQKKAGAVVFFEDIGLDLGVKISGVVRNEQADALAAIASNSNWFLLLHLERHCLLAGGNLVSGNSRHFVRDVFRSVHRVH
ncbi:hypothetical protein G9A89_016562 [Geosiphon pyriformis]|nr:hypothetical protein G9A89_016562 [Geosiphon pyriformis]